MKIETTRHLHGGYSIPRRTAGRRIDTGAARKNSIDRAKCSRCSLRDIELSGLSAQGNTILALLDRDCELRHVYLRQRWQGNSR
jgi:hypothetical protein